MKQGLGRLASRAPLPAIAVDKAGRFLLRGNMTGTAQPGRGSLIQRPGNPPEVLKLPDFVDCWAGGLIFFKSKASYAGELSKFDFSWFIPAIVKHRRLLRRNSSHFVRAPDNRFGHAFFQVVMDRCS